jgi:hypothetical protein
MIKLLKFLFNEPLFHFFFLGGALYLYYGAFQTPKTQVQKVQKITLLKSAAESENDFALRVYESVLLQEADALDLEKSDPMIAKLLLEKMVFLLQNTQAIQEPSEELLHKYYKEHIVDYSRVEKLSFSYIETSNLDEQRFQKLQQLATIQKLVFPKDTKQIELQDTQTIAKEFGRYFLKELLETPTAQWSKILRTKNGLAMVYIKN